MKKLFGIAIAMAALLILVGCEGEVELTAPDVDYTVDDTGATLALSWVEVADADGYYIYADGAVIDTIDDPAIVAYDADVPAAEYGVSAYAGDSESEITTIDCEPVETTNITVYGNSDPAPDHPSGIGFTTNGNCVALALSDSTNWPDLDFFFNDAAPTQGVIDIVSPDDHVPPYNDEENASANSGTDYDGLDIADAPGGYTTQTEIVANAVYSLWIDPDHDGWDDDNDHFGKMMVESVTGSTAPYTVVITVAYQPIAGLRWLVTD